MEMNSLMPSRIGTNQNQMGTDTKARYWTETNQWGIQCRMGFQPDGSHLTTSTQNFTVLFFFFLFGFFALPFLVNTSVPSFEEENSVARQSYPGTCWSPFLFFPGLQSRLITYIFLVIQSQHYVDGDILFQRTRKPVKGFHLLVFILNRKEYTTIKDILEFGLNIVHNLGYYLSKEGKTLSHDRLKTM